MIADLDIRRTVFACIANGNRLLEETYDLEFRQPPSSRYFLIMIAQEEFSKAFVFYLVREDIAQLSKPLLRAVHNHSCKHLVGMIMDYMIMHWDDVEEFHSHLCADRDAGDGLPNEVGSALQILRYEKIGRWEAKNWAWGEDPNYEKGALRVSEGVRDRRKQQALYVGVSQDGRVTSTPDSITEQETQTELERAIRFARFLDEILKGEVPSLRYGKVMKAFKTLFAPS